MERGANDEAENRQTCAQFLVVKVTSIVKKRRSEVKHEVNCCEDEIQLSCEAVRF